MIRKIILFLFVVLGLALLIVLPQRLHPVQVDPLVSDFIFPDTLSGVSYDWDSLRSLVGSNKGLPAGFEEAALLALSAYPQLYDVNVNMVLTQKGAPMESNFELSTLLKHRSKRVYEIRLNDAQESMFEPILLRSLPFDAQVGILAHELGHVAYYDQLSTLQIAKWGLLYLVSMRFRAKHEKSTDMMPVYHGLGSQIYQYAYYVRKDDTTKDMYAKWGKLFIDRFYLTDDELREAIDTYQK
ncbi:MAG: hypothetical protein ACI8QD_000883 [Cyclobacteriaceae bacterium]|jgi:hypothetical protein